MTKKQASYKLYDGKVVLEFGNKDIHYCCLCDKQKLNDAGLDDWFIESLQVFLETHTADLVDRWK